MNTTIAPATFTTDQFRWDLPSKTGFAEASDLGITVMQPLPMFFYVTSTRSGDIRSFEFKSQQADDGDLLFTTYASDDIEIIVYND